MEYCIQCGKTIEHTAKTCSSIHSGLPVELILCSEECSNKWLKVARINSREGEYND